MMNISPKLIAGAGSFVVAAAVSAMLLGTTGFASGHSPAVAQPASHQHVAIGATGVTAIGLTLSVKPAPVRIAVQPTTVTLTSTTKPKKATKSTDPITCPGMGGTGGYGPGGHKGGGKPGGH
jgi:hypothetical protein